MASGDTKTNQYLDIAANGTRADLPSDTCCETRSQTLIREVAERVMDVEDEVEELKKTELMPAKWQLLIELSQRMILEKQKT